MPSSKSPPPPPTPYFGESALDKPVGSTAPESKKKTPPRRRTRDASVYHAKPKGGKRTRRTKRLRRSRKNKSRRRH